MKMTSGAPMGCGMLEPMDTLVRRNAGADRKKSAMQRQNSRNKLRAHILRGAPHRRAEWSGIWHTKSNSSLMLSTSECTAFARHCPRIQSRRGDEFSRGNREVARQGRPNGHAGSAGRLSGAAPAGGLLEEFGAGPMFQPHP